jgi:hypothetical protein
MGFYVLKWDILKTTTSTGVPFGKFRMVRKSHHLMERVYAHLSKNGCRKSGLLADPELYPFTLSATILSIVSWSHHHPYTIDVQVVCVSILVFTLFSKRRTTGSVPQLWEFGIDIGLSCNAHTVYPGFFFRGNLILHFSRPFLIQK